MVRGPKALRHAALLAAGALVLHELRYRIGYGHDAADAVAAQGHGYLALVAGSALVLLVAAGSGFALALARSPRGVRSCNPAFAASWLGSSAALAAIYSLQELVEGSLAAGHPAGLAGLAGHGGWSAFALALALGALIALAQRGADEALALAVAAAASAPAWRRRRVLPVRPRAGASVAPPRPSPLSLHLAGRAPPGLR